MTDTPDMPEMPELTEDQKDAMRQVESVEIHYRRPGVLTFVAIVLWIQAGLAVVSALSLFSQRDDAAYQALTGQTFDEIRAAAGAELLFAIVFVLAGFGIWSGSRWARLLVAVVYGFRLAVSGWYILTHLGGGISTIGVIQAGIAIFVLWALYGNDKSERFFGDKGVFV